MALSLLSLHREHMQNTQVPLLSEFFPQLPAIIPS
jgi:hypothetical protein